MSRKILVGGLLACLLATTAWAERASFPVNQTQVLNRGEGLDTEACVLLGFDGIAALRSGVSVATAEFRVPLGAERPEGRVILEAHPVLGSWAEFQSAFGGRTDLPGGDYYREIYTRARLDEGREYLVFDLAGILTEMGDGLSVNGLAVTAVGGGDRGLDGNALLALDRLSEGSLEVTYRKVADVPERARVAGSRSSTSTVD
jgi:hypothetical protein